MPGYNTFSCYIEGQQYFLGAENNEVFLIVSNNTSSVEWLNGIQSQLNFKVEVHLTQIPTGYMPNDRLFCKPCIRLKPKKVPPQKWSIPLLTQLSRVAK